MPSGVLCVLVAYPPSGILRFSPMMVSEMEAEFDDGMMREDSEANWPPAPSYLFLSML